jgi:hypothetical protein
LIIGPRVAAGDYSDAAGEPGSEIQAPMAIVILFGLVSSTLLNMVAVPSLYYRFGESSRVPGRRSTRGSSASGARAAYSEAGTAPA